MKRPGDYPNELCPWEANKPNRSAARVGAEEASPFQADWTLVGNRANPATDALNPFYEHPLVVPQLPQT